MRLKGMHLDPVCQEPDLAGRLRSVGRKPSGRCARNGTLGAARSTFLRCSARAQRFFEACATRRTPSVGRPTLRLVPIFTNHSQFMRTYAHLFTHRYQHFARERVHCKDGFRIPLSFATLASASSRATRAYIPAQAAHGPWRRRARQRCGACTYGARAYTAAYDSERCVRERLTARAFGAIRFDV
jgi:hypothetical protein